MIGRILLALGAVVAGLVVGVAGAFVQAQRFVISVADSVVILPWGAVLAVVAMAFAIRGGVWTARARWGGWLLFLGWLGATLLMATETSSGDIALSSGARQMGYLLIGVVIGSAAATFPLPLGTRTRPSHVAVMQEGESGSG